LIEPLAIYIIKASAYHRISRIRIIYAVIETYFCSAYCDARKSLVLRIEERFGRGNGGLYPTNPDLAYEVQLRKRHVGPEI